MNNKKNETVGEHLAVNLIDSIAEKIDDDACRKRGIKLYRSFDRSGREIFVTVPDDDDGR